MGLSYLLERKRDQAAAIPLQIKITPKSTAALQKQLIWELW